MSVNLLFSIDDGYVDQFKVTLYSVVKNCSQKDLAIYVLQPSVLEQSEAVTAYCKALGVSYHPIVVEDALFANAPTTDRYPKTIYYRLLAHEMLPDHLDKILYLDADILCLNDMMSLYQLDMTGMLYAAASHIEDNDMMDFINKKRLRNIEATSYFNSGVLLMNLEAIRQSVRAQDIFDYIDKHRTVLFLPDQDVLNGLYGHQTILIPEEIFNYDARYSLVYLMRSNREWDLDWVINHTVFLHFCGRDKPWKKDYRGRFSGLYKYVARKAGEV
ncbi:glycosyltransferase family 8 protein [Streptococcus moroccensis]|uniref:Lipopolysaccharide biosynthesis glycosyltransferase n=1 Tax=Streptococcus moroccensis TaxID=1451356 RepID=A0ABT9YQ37_9STRE|nr:glycosyltransferase family 8 protein [Streptococcus moroccensis]MDQ0222115.1 lipopolysaccharide biosynthesis glycosyltransferase [Streptococcus moroccensis]